MQTSWTWLLVVFLLASIECCPTTTSAQQSPSDLSGLSHDEIFKITDDRPLTTNDPTLTRLLQRVNQSSRNSLRRFSTFTQDVDLQEVIKHPRDFRCYVFDIRGIAKSVRSFAISVDDSTATIREFDIVRVVTDDGTDCLVVVCDNGIPNRWPGGDLNKERIEFTGFFLARHQIGTEETDEDSESIVEIAGLENNTCPVFVAKRIRWYPESDSGLFEVRDSELLLARHGVDISRLDIVRDNISGRIQPEDSDSFYQLLQATQTIAESSIPTNFVDFKDCLQDPQRFQSSPVFVRGQVRRATKVNVIDENVQRDLGQNHYFQLDVFVPLDGHKIVIRPAGTLNSDKSENLISHDNRFPITICAAELPCAAKEIENKKISCAGFFFKRWTYENELTLANPGMPQQLSPLIIALKPRIILPAHNSLNLWITIACLSGITGLAVMYWFFGPGDRQGRAELNKLNRELPDKIELPTSDPL